MLKNILFLLKTRHLVIFLMVFVLISCNNNSKDTNMPKEIKIVFLHHSTGMTVWNGNTSSFRFKLGQIINKISRKQNLQPKLPRLFRSYNNKNNTNYSIKEMAFPKEVPYGWNNNPYDYYNIWVKNAGYLPYMEEPTLELLTKEYQVIVFKHCYPVSNIQPDKDLLSIDSDYKSIGNYKLQYLALRDKMLQFPETKFIIWTGAVKVKSDITEDEAKRTKEFFNWVKDVWDLPGDNIFIWDLYQLETEGGLYLKPEYATSDVDSHPNNKFSGFASNLFFNRIIDVIENNGEKTSLSGEKK